MSKALLLLSLFLASVGAAAETKPLRALLVTGGCCHDYTTQKTILSEGVHARANVEFTVVQEGGDTREHEMSIYTNAAWARGFDVIVHNECFGMVTNNALLETIAAAHESGIPAVMLHCSTHSYRAAKTDAWRRTLGMSSYSHEKRRDLVIKNLQPEHPVMKGFPAVWNDKQDELYKNEKVWPNVTPLAKSYGEETKKDHIVIWLNTVGQGRVFATTLGHGNETMRDPVYLDLVTRGLLWACGRLGEDGRPVSGYGPVAR